MYWPGLQEASGMEDVSYLLRLLFAFRPVSRTAAAPADFNAALISSMLIWGNQMGFR